MFWRKKNKNKAEQKNTNPQFDMPGISKIKVVVKTDLGNVRTNNEDAGAFFKVAGENSLRANDYLLLVADGMGGHNAGEVASKMAAEIISQEYFKAASEQHIEKILAKAFTTTNKKIFEMAAVNKNCRGMGTTCTAVVIAEDKIYYAHAGDSRAYLYKNETITRLTEDHTYVQQLVNNGDISLAEAEMHPQRNILTNAMGTKPNLRVDTGKSQFTFEENDRLLLCSDGLYDYFSDEELKESLRYPSLQDAADYLIAEAKQRGGKDNITVVLAEKTAVTVEQTELKLTRDVDLPKLTRDADLPSGI
jgi:PPM family protein phosphatase